MSNREPLGGFRQRVTSTRTGRLSWQLLIALLGAVVVVIGVILIPFPGPGWRNAAPGWKRRNSRARKQDDHPHRTARGTYLQCLLPLLGENS